MSKPRVGASLKMLSSAIIEVSRVLTFGHEKHGGDFEGGRMLSPTCVEDCTDSMCRHLLDDMRGVEIDDETKLKQAAHTAANALIILEALCRKETDK